MISLVVAMSPARVIGIDGGLPWHLSADLKRFKALTMGGTLLMGRATHQSIGRALPGRDNWVLTSQPDKISSGCQVFENVEAVLAQHDSDKELFIIGGASLYEIFLPRASRFYVTVVHTDVAGDRFFPAFSLQGWRVVQTEHGVADERNEYPHTFHELEREPGKAWVTPISSKSLIPKALVEPWA